MSKYTVLSPLKYNRKRYAVGDTIDLSNAAAKPLSDLGVIGTFVEKEKPAKAPPASSATSSTPPAPPDVDGVGSDVAAGDGQPLAA